MNELKWTATAPIKTAWSKMPFAPGIYQLHLTGALPQGMDWPAELRPLKRGDLLYVGKATNLKSRAKHHGVQTSKSTFRRSLAALMGLQAQWHGRSAHPRLTDADEEVLTVWMERNLGMQYALVPEPELLADLEEAMRAELCPPMNRDGRTPEQLHVSAAAAAGHRAALREKG
ncbi:GIY-YIG nuclease family protein [Specibacter sp. NPDC057265]|uniref:GIY-YIG nuclease family protein n=1 Tax=Specibacter sp. NPDC057265 TaxID=3346075 RepID=UPI0036343F3D